MNITLYETSLLERISKSSCNDFASQGVRKACNMVQTRHNEFLFANVLTVGGYNNTCAFLKNNYGNGSMDFVDFNGDCNTLKEPDLSYANMLYDLASFRQKQALYTEMFLNYANLVARYPLFKYSTSQPQTQNYTNYYNDLYTIAPIEIITAGYDYETFYNVYVNDELVYEMVHNRIICEVIALAHSSINGGKCKDEWEDI